MHCHEKEQVDVVYFAIPSLPLTLPFWWKGLFLSGSKEMHFSDVFFAWHDGNDLTRGLQPKLLFMKKYDA